MSLNGKMPLQASFLITNNKTLKDLKTEIVLTFALQLFDEYQHIKEDNGEIKNTITVKNPKNNDIAIMIEYTQDLNQPLLHHLYQTHNQKYER